MRKHGYSKRRTWRKVHVGMCADSGQVIVSAVTSNNMSDDEVMPHLIEVLEGIPLGDVIGDGAYDTTDCRESIHGHGRRQIIPPDKNARLQKRKPLPCLKARDDAIRRIQELEEEGRTKWKREIGYHRRSRVETLIYRYKTILGDRLASRKESTQATEVAVKLDVLNRMIELGMPKSYKVAT